VKFSEHSYILYKKSRPYHSLTNGHVVRHTWHMIYMIWHLLTFGNDYRLSMSK
jgi:hypothetical protein